MGDLGQQEFSDRADLLAYNDDWLINRYRYPRAIILDLCTVLEWPTKVKQKYRKFTVKSTICNYCYQLHPCYDKGTIG